MVSRRRVIVAVLFLAGLLALAPLMRPAHATTSDSTTNSDTTPGTAASARNPFETLTLTPQPAPLSGIPTNCPTIHVAGVPEIPDGGWTWVDPASPIQELTGVVNQTTE